MNPVCVCLCVRVYTCIVHICASGFTPVCICTVFVCSLCGLVMSFFSVLCLSCGVTSVIAIIWVYILVLHPADHLITSAGDEMRVLHLWMWKVNLTSPCVLYVSLISLLAAQSTSPYSLSPMQFPYYEHNPEMYLLCVFDVTPSVLIEPIVSELSGLSLFLSLSYSPLPYLCFLPVCVLAAVSVRGDAAGAPGDRSVSRQPAGEAPPGGVDAAATALTSGGTSGASCRCQPQQRKTVRGHGTAWTPFPQTGAGGCPGREGVQPHPHLSRVQTLPRTEDAPHRGPRGPPISHSQWGEHRMGQDHK